jgi:hypothetical protein
MVIQSGSFQPGVIEREPQWADQVQAAAGVGAQADDVARVGRYFRLVKNDVKHGVFPGRGDLRRNEFQIWCGFPGSYARRAIWQQAC